MFIISAMDGREVTLGSSVVKEAGVRVDTFC